ncbi:MAG: hypothetical protein P8M22_00030 [Phycisphaerales bacterium]|nr:hypothetical protein [Phycisphaerales bacterium]
MTEKALNGTLQPKMPNYTLPMIKGMSGSQIRQALVEVSQARKFARGNPQMQDSLTYQFNILMGGLKNLHNASSSPQGMNPPGPPTVDSQQSPNFTLEQIQSMSTAQIRQALVEVSQARKFARGNRQMQDSLDYQFDMLMNTLKTKAAPNKDN